MTDTSIKIKDKIYPVQSTGEVISENLLSGYLFRILDQNSDNIIGCLSCYISATVTAIWNNNWDRQVSGAVLLNLYNTILPHINLPVDLDIIKQKYPLCIKIVITSQNSGYNYNDNIMYIKGKDNPELLVQELIFNNNPDDSNVEKEILKILYDHWKQNYNTNILVGDLESKLFIPQKLLLRNLDFLAQEDSIKANKDANQDWISVGISNKGIKDVRGNFPMFNNKNQIIQGDIVKGDKITAQTLGDSSPIVIKSEDISFAYNLLDKLKTEIEESYKDDDKRQLIQKIEEVRELSNSKNNYSKIRSVLGTILTKTSETAQIASLIIELVRFFS